VHLGASDWTCNPQDKSVEFLENPPPPLGPQSREHHAPSSFASFPSSEWTGLASASTNYDPISKLPLPQHWCSITYYELDVQVIFHRSTLKKFFDNDLIRFQVGEIFKVPICHKSVAVDGYMERNDKRRFCLGAQSNVHRTDVSKRARLHIGRGIQLQLIGSFLKSSQT